LLFSNSKPKALEKGKVGDGEGRKKTIHLLMIGFWAFEDLRKIYKIQIVLQGQLFFCFSVLV